MNISALYDLFLKHGAVSTDTRTLKPGEIFFALRGPNFDANKLVYQALELGASFAVSDDPLIGSDERIIKTHDVLETLQQLANHHRRNCKATIIGITGSNGKTTTKELMGRVLSRRYETLYTPGNLNNHIGLPLTLLMLKASTELAVIEMGANHQGENRKLCLIAEPDYGIVTNIGKDHLEGFGGFTGAINANSELYSYIDDKGGMLFVNRDNELLDRLSARIKRFTYGSSLDNDLYGELVSADPFIHIAWEFGHMQAVLKTRLIGDYNTENVLAAIAVGCHFGIPKQQINEAIAGYEPKNNRSQLIDTGRNKVIMDAYNANPSSMEAAIRNFDLIRGRRSTFILGDMLEMGTYSAQEHANILRLLTDIDAESVLLVGEEFGKVYAGDDWLHFDNVDALCRYLDKNKLSGHDILVKASRGIHLEKALPYL
ncbi:MAG TPA: UDP-N-acetylmuramoyl-tripeptide--D-alanyl-D-alanine ligase [Bacteroidales bacterium]|nr:UDP-N-acetylmuramoyl-tripeptide--D-alanyl-D-alanine ligase [Bacteroidales bacterium]